MKAPNMYAGNADDVRRFFDNQQTMTALVADLAYPLHRLIKTELDRGVASQGGGYNADRLAPQYLLDPKCSFRAGQRTGSFIDLRGLANRPRLGPGALEYLAFLVHRLDRERNRAYEKAKQQFVREFLAGFSYAILLSIQPELSAVPVKEGCPLKAREQRAAVTKLNALFEENVTLADRLVRNNHGLVHIEARRVLETQGGMFDELLVWGTGGLLDGIYRYTPDYQNAAGEVGARAGLAGVVSNWIRHHITRSAQYHSRTIAVPVAAQKTASVARRVSASIGKESPTAVAEAILLGKLGEADPELAVRIAAEPDNVIAELWATETWQERVCAMAKRIRDATDLPTSESVDYAADAGSSDDRGDKTNAAAASVAAESSGAAHREEAIDALFKAMGGMHINGKLVLALSFQLPNAGDAAREYLAGVIAQSTERTVEVERQRREAAGTSPRAGCAARITILDQMAGKEDGE
jgi:hypothetical protein